MEVATSHLLALTYEGSDAASTDGRLKVALQLLLDGAGGVEALNQQENGVDEEEGGNAVDDVLKDLDPGRSKQTIASSLFLLSTF